MNLLIQIHLGVKIWVKHICIYLSFGYQIFLTREQLIETVVRLTVSHLWVGI